MKPQNLFSKRVYIRLARRDIALFRFLLESWDNLAYMTVVDKYKAVVVLSYAPGSDSELREFLDCVNQEMELKVVF